MHGYVYVASGGVSLLAAVVAVLGNHWLHRRIGRRLQAAAEVRRLLYDFLDLISVRWSPKSENVGPELHAELQAKVWARQGVVLGALRNMRIHSKKLKKWYEDIESCRDDLFDAASSDGPTGHGESQHNHERIRRASEAVKKIIRKMEAAC